MRYFSKNAINLEHKLYMINHESNVLHLYLIDGMENSFTKFIEWGVSILIIYNITRELLLMALLNWQRPDKPKGVFGHNFNIVSIFKYF